MRLFKWFRQLARRSIENPAVPWSEAVETLLDAFGASKSKTGEAVNAHTAQGCSAYYGGVRILVDTAASLPIGVYRLPTGTYREPQRQHPVDELLRLRPNPTITGQIFREQLIRSFFDHGNAYARIKFAPSGTVSELWSLDASRTEVVLQNGTLSYQTSDDRGVSNKLFPGEVLHVPLAPEAGTVAGRPMIATARNAIAVALAAETVGANWLRQGALAPFWLKLERMKFDDPKFTEFAKHLHKMRNEQRAIWLGDADTAPPTELKADHGVVLEWRVYQTLELSRFLGVPPFMLAESEKGAPKSSVQEQTREFANHTLRPLLTRFEAEFDSKLFADDPTAGLVVRHDLTELLRADTRTLWWTFSIARQMGILNPNEIREVIGRPGYGTAGDQYLSPVNLDRVPRALELVGRLERELDMMLRDVAESVATEDRGALLGAADDGTENLADWAAEYYQNGRRLQIARALETAGERFAEIRLQPLGVRSNAGAWHDYVAAVSSTHTEGAITATEQNAAAWIAGGRLTVDAREALAALVGMNGDCDADQIEP